VVLEIFSATAATDVVNVHLEARMAQCDLTESSHVGAARQKANPQIVLLARIPEPVERAVGPPGLLMRLVERETEAEHARALAPVRDDLFAVGTLQIEVTEDAELV